MKTIRCNRCASEIPIVPGRQVICLSCGTNLSLIPLYQSDCEFCPQCGGPLEVTTDPGRLCEICGWFGDRQETLSTPPCREDFDAILAVLQSLELFRDVCRKEQLVEVYYDTGRISDHDLRRVRKDAQAARQSLVTMFTALRRRLPQVLLIENGMIPWPKNWADRHFNASQEPCDMLIGHCSCGACHTEKEGWVQSALQRYGAIIIPGDQP